MIVKNLGIARLKLESRHVGRDDNNKWRHTQFFWDSVKLFQQIFLKTNY